MEPPAGWRKPNLLFKGFSGTLGFVWGDKVGIDQRLVWEVSSNLSNSRICRDVEQHFGLCVPLKITFLPSEVSIYEEKTR